MGQCECSFETGSEMATEDMRAKVFGQGDSLQRYQHYSNFRNLALIVRV